MKRLMFQTFGLGANVVDSSLYSIKVYNPDHLIVFCTEQSRRKSLGELLARLHDDAPQAEMGRDFEAWSNHTESIEGANEEWSLNWRVSSGLFEDLRISAPTHDDLERFNNAESLHLAYQRLIEDAFERFVDLPEKSWPHAIADYTRGTRPMSAALFGAAYAAGIPLIVYVGGERDENGFVIPGTETIHQTQGQRLRASDTLGKAVRLFNTGDFSAAARVARELEGTAAPQLPFNGSAVELIASASDAFGAWDRFRFKEALDTMQQLGESLDEEFVGRHLMTKRHRERIQRHLYHAQKATNHDDRPEDDTGRSGVPKNQVGLAADLVANADRRIQAEAFDDALGRLYRALEYIAQIRVEERFGISSEAVPVSLLRETFDDVAPPASEGNDDDEETRPVGMKRGWDLLKAHDDDLGMKFQALCDSEDLLISISMRNSSILAHGFKPVEPQYVDVMRSCVVELAETHWGKEDWRGASEVCEFPRISDL